MDSTTGALLTHAQTPGAVMTVQTATLLAVQADGTLLVDVTDGSGRHTVTCAGHRNATHPGPGPVLLGYSQGAYTVLVFLAASTGADVPATAAPTGAAPQTDADVMPAVASGAAPPTGSDYTTGAT